MDHGSSFLHVHNEADANGRTEAFRTQRCRSHAFETAGHASLSSTFARMEARSSRFRARPFFDAWKGWIRSDTSWHGTRREESVPRDVRGQSHVVREASTRCFRSTGKRVIRMENESIRNKADTGNKCCGCFCNTRRGNLPKIHWRADANAGELGTWTTVQEHRTE